MNTLKEYRDVKELHRSLLTSQHEYRRAKHQLAKLIREKRSCCSAGYIQHYPEYNSMIGQSLANLKIIKKQLKITADTLRIAISK